MAPIRSPRGQQHWRQPGAETSGLQEPRQQQSLREPSRKNTRGAAAKLFGGIKERVRILTRGGDVTPPTHNKVNAEPARDEVKKEMLFDADLHAVEHPVREWVIPARGSPKLSNEWVPKAQMPLPRGGEDVGQALRARAAEYVRYEDGDRFYGVDFGGDPEAHGPAAAGVGFPGTGMARAGTGVNRAAAGRNGNDAAAADRERRFGPAPRIQGYREPPPRYQPTAEVIARNGRPAIETGLRPPMRDIDRTAPDMARRQLQRPSYENEYWYGQQPAAPAHGESEYTRRVRFLDSRRPPLLDDRSIRGAHLRSRQLENRLLGVLRAPPGRSPANYQSRHADEYVPPPRPTVPHQFHAYLQELLVRNKTDFTPEVYDYYVSELRKRDSKCIPGLTLGEPSLVEEILKEDAMERLKGRTGRGWRPVKTLGRGGQGGVVLWEKVRENGEPIRLATKDMSLDNLFFRDYNNEGHMTRRLNDAGCENVIRVLEWALLDDGRKFRIAYEVAEYGDLHHTIKWYKSRGLFFPEHFLWHIFYGLANALTYCANGHNRGPDPDPNWEDIIHSDLKPGNILIGAANPAVNRHYPTVKVADFGLAFTMPRNRTDIRSFKSRYSAGTPGYRAPEVDQLARGRPARQTAYPLQGTHSDVWAVGNIILEMVKVVEPHLKPKVRESTPAMVAQTVHGKVYSSELLQLIARCMRTDGRERPSPWSIYQTTRKHAEAAQKRLDWEQDYAVRSKADHALFPSKVLMTAEERDRFLDHSHYRQAYKDHQDYMLGERKMIALRAQASARQSWTGQAPGPDGGQVGLAAVPEDIESDEDDEEEEEDSDKSFFDVGIDTSNRISVARARLIAKFEGLWGPVEARGQKGAKIDLGKAEKNAAQLEDAVGEALEVMSKAEKAGRATRLGHGSGDGLGDERVVDIAEEEEDSDHEAKPKPFGQYGMAAGGEAETDGEGRTGLTKRVAGMGVNSESRDAKRDRDDYDAEMGKGKKRVRWGGLG